MGLFDTLKDGIKKLESELSKEQQLKDQAALKKHAITMARIDRHHAKQELARAQENKIKAQEYLDSVPEQTIEYQKALKEFKNAQKVIKEQSQKVIQCTDEIEKSQTWLKDTKQLSHENRKKILQDTLTNVKSDLKETVEDVMDTFVSMPGQMKELAEKVADNAVATLSDMNDAMTTAIHDTAEKGVMAFHGLSGTIDAAKRAGITWDIKLYEKDLEKLNKLERKLDSIERTIDIKASQVAEVSKSAKQFGSALKNLFTNFSSKEAPAKETPAQEEPSMEEIINKEFSEHKPGFLRRILNKRIAKTTNELSKNYQAMQQSLQHTIDLEKEFREQQMQNHPERSNLDRQVSDRIKNYEQSLVTAVDRGQEMADVSKTYQQSIAKPKNDIEH